MEDALMRLDWLAQEEARMAAAVRRKSGRSLISSVTSEGR